MHLLLSTVEVVMGCLLFIRYKLLLNNVVCGWAWWPGGDLMQDTGEYSVIPFLKTVEISINVKVVECERFRRCLPLLNSVVCGRRGWEF